MFIFLLGQLGKHEDSRSATPVSGRGILANASSIPPQFGGCWAAFSEDWCLGETLAASPTEVACALSTLVRLWPDKAAHLVSESARGTGVIVPVIELGLLLHACETAASFDEVRQRLGSGARFR